MRLQATQEGLVPLKTWIKNALDQIIQVCMGEPNLEFVWVGDDAVDPLQQAQTLQILVSAGIKTREEARAELGLGGDASGAKAGAPGLGKFNPYHSRATGQFTSADDSDAQGSDSLWPRLVAEDSVQATPAGHKLPKKILRDLAKRNWTVQQIDEAVRSGPRIDALNKATGGPATRYVDSSTGRSVVIDNTTNEVIHVGEEGFAYGPESGDVPGAVMRPPLSSENSSGSAVPPPSTMQNTPRVPPTEPVAPLEPIAPIEPVDPILPIEPLP